MQADEAAFEEVAQRQPLLSRSRPAVVIGIADDKARKHEEEVHGQMAMIEDINGAAFRKGKTFEHMIPHHHQCSRSAQTVQQLIVGF